MTSPYFFPKDGLLATQSLLPVSYSTGSHDYKIVQASNKSSIKFISRKGAKRQTDFISHSLHNCAGPAVRRIPKISVLQKTSRQVVLNDYFRNNISTR